MAKDGGSTPSFEKGAEYVPPEKKERKAPSYRVLLVLAFFTLNVVFNYFNKFLFSTKEKNGAGFQVPILATMSHASAGFLAAMVFTFVPSVYVRKPIEGAKMTMTIVGISIFFAGSIGLNNSSLQFLPLSMQQTIRSSGPAVVAVCSYFLEDKVFSYKQIASLVLLVGGVSLAVFGDQSGTEDQGGIGLQAPLFMTMCHAITCFTMAFILSLTPFFTTTRLTHQGILQVLAVAVFFACGIGFNNSSLMYIPLSLAQMIKALHPAVLAIMLYFLEGTSFTRKRVYAIMGIVTGVVCCVAGSIDLDVSVLGIALSFGSVMSGALHIAFISLAMKSRLKFSSLDLMYYTNIPVFFILMAPAYLTGEIERVEDFAIKQSQGRLVLCLVVGSCIAACYNLVTLLFIRTLSALYLSITGTSKVAVVIVLSVVFFGDPISSVNAIGTLITIIAFGYNSYLTYLQKAAEVAKAKGVSHPPRDT